MHRFLFILLLLVTIGVSRPGSAQPGSAEGLPSRPDPFRFVNDQAQLLTPADAKKLENGLRRYADNTGTQVVVVTVPSLGGRDVADYGRALGESWGVGQREKNNGLVVVVSAQEHKMTIQPGSGLKNTITPAVTSRVINQMTPSFKQGNYFTGLRAGLNTLMLTANPDSNPQKNQSGGGTEVLTATNAASTGGSNPNDATTVPAVAPEATTQTPVAPAEPVSSGPGMGALLLGALVIGAILWFVLRLFRGRRAAAGPANATPDFLPSRFTNSTNYGPGPGPGNYSGMPNNYGGAPNSSGGMGMGGILATGAAAAAGAYLGNRMASGHDTSGNNLSGGESLHDFGAGAAGAAGTGAAGDYFSARDAGADASAPDYFSADDSADSSSSDYFSADDNSPYDDLSSGDTGGGGFDGDSGSSGSW